MAEQTIYNHTELTEITQYNVEDVYKDGSDTELAFGKPKRFVPVFHGLQERPSSEEQPNPIQLYEGHVEIGGPSQTPWDIEEYDDEILAQSGREKDVHPDAIQISPATGTVKVGKTLQLNAIVSPAGSEFPVIWDSSNKNKATVSDNGLVTGVAEGEDIEITARTGAVSASAVIKVEKIPVSSVSIEETKQLMIAETFRFIPEVLPADATYRSVTWSTSDDTIVSITQDGIATALAEGEATITVTSTDDDTKTDTCVVTVVMGTP